MTDRHVSFDVIIYDKQGARSSTSGRADTLGEAVAESTKAIVLAVNNEGVNFGFATIVLARRHDDNKGVF